MIDRPILFSGPMVRALLNGRKTQTRRVLRTTGGTFKSPNYRRGDRLWVRETWAVGNIYDGMAPRDINPGGKPGWCGIRFAATQDRIGIKDRPSIFMPRWASRLTLTVTNVRVQRLQDISEDDAIAEGCRPYFDHDNPSEHAGPNGTVHLMAPLRGPVDDFHRLWDSLNADRAPWASNPWVCAVSFTVHPFNIDQEAE